MTELYIGYTTYFLLAIIGTALYFIKIFLSMFWDDHSSPTDSFNIWTIQAFLAFLMGLGWMGLATKTTWLLSDGMALFISFLFGITMLWLDVYLSLKLRSLNIIPKKDPKKFIGMTAQTYTQISARNQGVGQIIVTINGQQKTMPAITKGEKIDSFNLVKIVDVDNAGHLIVEKTP